MTQSEFDQAYAEAFTYHLSYPQDCLRIVHVAAERLGINITPDQAHAIS